MSDAITGAYYLAKTKNLIERYITEGTWMSEEIKVQLRSIYNTMDLSNSQESFNSVNTLYNEAISIRRGQVNDEVFIFFGQITVYCGLAFIAMLINKYVRHEKTLPIVNTFWNIVNVASAFGVIFGFLECSYLMCNFRSIENSENNQDLMIFDF
jgi:hypothetical protein